MPDRLNSCIRSIIAWLRVQYGLSFKEAQGVLNRSKFYRLLEDTSNGLYFLPIGKLITIFIAELNGNDFMKVLRLLDKLQ